MASIFIDEKIFVDQRFINLTLTLGCQEKALGAWARALYWSQGCHRINSIIWEEQKLNKALLDCGLIEKRQGGYFFASNEPKKEISPISPENIYKLYPRKVGKRRGIQIFNKFIKTQQDFDNVLKALNNYINYLKEQKCEAQYIKHFSTWANEWEDWLDPQTGSANNFDSQDSANEMSW